MNKISSDYKSYIDKFDWHYKVCLTFSKDLSIAKSKVLKRKNSIIKAEELLRIFSIRFNRSVFGRRSKKMIEMIPVMEFTAQGRPHFHILIKSEDKINDNDLKDRIMYYWSMSRFTSIRYHQNPENADWFQVIKPGTQLRAIKYNLKDVWKNTTHAVILDYLYPKEHDVWKKQMSKYK